MIRTLVEIQGGRVSVRETGTGQTEISVTVDGELSGDRLPSRNLYTDDEVAAAQASEAELVSAPLRRRVSELENELARRTRERDEREQARANLEKSLGEVITKLQEKVWVQWPVTGETEKERANQQETNWKLERDRADRLQARVNKADAEVDRLKKGHVCTRSCRPNAHVAFTGRQRLEELERELHDETQRADQAEKSLEESRSLVARQGAQHDRTLRARDAETEERVKRRDIVIRNLERALEETRRRVQSAQELLTTPEVVQARRMDCSRTGTTMGYAIGAALRVLEGPPSPPTETTSQA
jgi:hypothetical protein